ncbi:MAG: exonuclease SbcCD subunit D [Saprospiraceae bacterium]
MKILHFSDTHLGYNELDKVGSNGVNLREQDFYDAFSYVIDQALILRPDLIIHSGDFFHRPSPPNRPKIFALEQLSRLSSAKIPILIIAGNHETPKTIYTSPILRAFNTIDGVWAIHGQAYEQFEFGELVVHGLPHINDDKVQLSEMEKIKPVDGKFNIILLHTSIGKRFIMEEYGEKLYPPERMELLNQFNYVALGHWHNFQKVSKLDAGWYCGSTERMSDTEAGIDKGFCTFELEKDKVVVPDFHVIPTRNWLQLTIENCHEKTVDDIEDLLEDFAKSNPIKDAIVTLQLLKVKSSQSITLTNRKIKTIFQTAIQVLIKRQFSDDVLQNPGIAQKTERLDTLMKDFILTNIEEKSQAAALVEAAQKYINLYETGEW